jgi:probable rRNA maturation factor
MKKTRPQARKPPKPPAITILVEEPRWRKDGAVLRLIRRAVRLASLCPLGGEGQGKGGPRSVTILLTGDDRLRGLNASFRGLDKPTNVLSFPASPGDPSSFGDIALAYGVVKREARAQKKLFSAHAAHLAVHGTLHLLGYDHEKPNDARTMEGLETRLLATLGIANPYAPRPYTRGRSCA